MSDTKIHYPDTSNSSNIETDGICYCSDKILEIHIKNNIHTLCGGKILENKNTQKVKGGKK